MVYFKLEFGFGRKRQVNNQLPTQPAAVSAAEFAGREARRISLEGKHKTAANYMTAVRSYAAFAGDKEWGFADLTPHTLEEYQRWLCSRGLCMNTVSVYMRSLRTLYNRATADSPAHDNCLFKNVYTGREHTTKRSASAADLRRLLSLDLPHGSSLAMSRDLFLFSFFAMGMPFVDMAHLRKSQIRDTAIHYARHKTAQKVCVAMEPRMRDIITRYADEASDYVFPILRGTTPDNISTTYNSRLRAYNYSLRRLSRLIGSSRPLSSYVARHSWASLAYCSNLDLTLIAKAMGHTKLTTTMTYIRTLFDPNLADANRRMLQSLGLQ